MAFEDMLVHHTTIDDCPKRTEHTSESPRIDDLNCPACAERLMHAIIARLDPNERVDVLASLTRRWCPGCGRLAPCHCENDE